MTAIGNILAWLLKNSALIVGVVEALAKLVAGIASLTPTKKDDWLIKKADAYGSKAKKVILDASDYFGGKK